MVALATQFLLLTLAVRMGRGLCFHGRTYPRPANTPKSKIATTGVSSPVHFKTSYRVGTVLLRSFSSDLLGAAESPSEPKARANVLRHINLVNELLVVRGESESFPFSELQKDLNSSKLLMALSKCAMEHLPSSVNVDGQVDSEYSMRVIKIVGGFDSITVGSEMIFVREFYEDLLTAIRSNHTVVLTGNPGIGKSVFQFYYLARILNPELFGPLPPDYRGRTDAPKVVIRQVDDKMTIYDIEKRVAYQELPADLRILYYFDPEVTLYLFDPSTSKNMESYCDNFEYSTLATVSPDSSRHKYFVRNKRMLPLYMPIYERQELLDVGNYMLGQETFPESLRSDDFYSPKNISDRYRLFGGVIRYVLPASIEKLHQYRAALDRALDECDLTTLLSSNIITDN